MRNYIGFAIIVSFVCLISNQAFAERLAVSVPKANIRSGPGPGYAVLWVSEKFFPVEVIEKKGVWRRFKDFEGDTGWIHESIVDKTPSVITKNEKCNVRSGPGTNHDIVFTVEKGVPFKVLEKKKTWIKVLHADGDTGWIHIGLVW